MKYSYTLPVVSSLATLALSATVNVTVGPGLVYTPDSVTAAQGDVVSFIFEGDHNVVSGDFDNPCQPNNVIYSGYPSENAVFSVTVNNTDPVWIYCSVPHHCQSGMAMVINPPSNETIDAYKQAASSVSSSGTPSNVAGGVFGGASSSASASSSGSPSATSSGSMSTSSTHSGAGVKAFGSSIGGIAAALAVALVGSTL